MSSSDTERRDEAEASETAAGDDEDTGAQVAPIVRLEEVAVTTGEEDEVVLLDLKSKLYRFDKEGNQWKERGAGTVKLLKHKETGKVRLVMRQAKTLKICANHLVVPSISIQEHGGNDKSCVWHASDFSDGELKEELFCIRFGSVENCKHFMEMVEEVAQSQGKKQESEDATTAAELVEKLSVSEGETKENKAGEEVPVSLSDKLVEKLSVAEGETKENKAGEEVPLSLSDKKSPEIVHVKTESEKKDEPSAS